jgi:hypothetical protein
VKGLGQGLHRRRLRQAGHTLQEQVPIGEEPDEQAVDHVPLADDDLVELGPDGVEARFELVHPLLQGGDALLCELRRAHEGRSP